MSSLFPLFRFFALSLILGMSAACALKEEAYRRAANEEASASLTKIADSSFEAENYEPALELYLRAYKKKPDDATLEKIALTFDRMGNPQASYQAYAMLYQKNPKNPLYLKNLAQAAFYAEDFEASQKHYQALLQMDPSDGNHLGAGVVEDVLGNHDAAQTHYRQVIQHSPRNLNAKNNLGLSLLLQGKVTEAESTLKALTERADSEARFEVNLALVYGVSGKAGQAQPLLEKYFPQDQVAAMLQFYQDYNLMTTEQRRRVVYGFPENKDTATQPNAGQDSLKALVPPSASSPPKS
ncbi:MAG: tetratricopeptide repeat protein [Alphaproteobacteria bacterium]